MAIFHIGLVFASDDGSLLPLSVLFWLSTGTLIWQKRSRIQFQASWSAQILAAALFVALLLIGLQAPADNYLAAMPFIAMIAFALGTTGWRFWVQYKPELLLMFMFGIPKVILWPIADLRGITARFTTMLLQLGQFAPVRDGNVIHLPTGSIDVVQDCSGLNGILYLLAMSALLLVMLPLHNSKRYWVPFIGVVVAFFTNGLRVAFLAIMAAHPDPTKFDAWHGSSAFSLGALGVFVGVYCLMLWRDQQSTAQS